MSFINFATKEITCKIVYYGPGLCGKTTNVQYIYNKASPSSRGNLISLTTEADRTLFFDFMPLSIGELPGGFKVRFYLYTVPGQIFYNDLRKLIIKGADGIVFVADSQTERLEANLVSLENLTANLQEHGFQLNTMPYAIQYNKRDTMSAMPLEELRTLLNPTLAPDFEAVATKGTGVFETLKAVSRNILIELRKKLSQNK